MFTQDTMNNVGRLCSVRGDLAGRKWKVRCAVIGHRYLLRNLDTGQFRTVSTRDMTSLY